MEEVGRMKKKQSRQTEGEAVEVGGKASERDPRSPGDNSIRCSFMEPLR